MPVHVPFVSVSFGSTRVEEIAYRDGAFVYPYLGSTRVGDTFSLRRTGGWPASPTVHVEECDGVAAPLGDGVVDGSGNNVIDGSGNRVVP